MGGRSREPSPRAWSTSAWEEEGGGGSRTDRIGGGDGEKGRKGFFERRREREIVIRGALPELPPDLSRARRRRDHLEGG